MKLGLALRGLVSLSQLETLWAQSHTCPSRSKRRPVGQRTAASVCPPTKSFGTQRTTSLKGKERGSKRRPVGQRTAASVCPPTKSFGIQRTTSLKQKIGGVNEYGTFTGRVHQKGLNDLCTGGFCYILMALLIS